MPKTTTEYSTDNELTKAVSDLLADESLADLQPLRDHQVIILCCVRTRITQDGETKPCKGSPVKLKKLSEMERLFIPDNAHYILMADYHWWKHANVRQQTAKLFDNLLTIQPEPKEGGGLTLKKREPVIDVKFTETLAYYGAFDHCTLLLRDAMKDSTRRVRDFVGELAEGPETTPAEGEPEPVSPGE